MAIKNTGGTNIKFKRCTTSFWFINMLKSMDKIKEVHRLNDFGDLFLTFESLFEEDEFIASLDEIINLVMFYFAKRVQSYRRAT